MSPWPHISARPQLSDGRRGRATHPSCAEPHVHSLDAPTWRPDKRLQRFTRWLCSRSSRPRCLPMRKPVWIQPLSGTWGARQNWLHAPPKPPPKPSGSLIAIRCPLWLCWSATSGSQWRRWKRRKKFTSSTLRSRQTACLDQLWRALLNASQRLISRLRRCDNSSLKAPALPLLQVAPYQCRLSRQLNQRQPPWSSDLRRIGEIEGAHTRHDATLSRSAKDPAPRSPWIQCLRNPPEQPGRKRRGPSLATAGPPRKQPLLCLSPPRLVLSVFMDPHGPTIAPRCPTAVIADKIKHMHFQKESKNLFLPTISVLPLCSQSAQPFQPLATWAEAWQAMAVSTCVMTTVRRGYTLQFAQRTPRFRGVLTTTVCSENTQVLCA